MYRVSIPVSNAVVGTWIVNGFNEQDAIDNLIDELEKDNNEVFIGELEEVEEQYNEDEYLIGGNKGLCLIHNGMLNIEYLGEEEE